MIHTAAPRFDVVLHRHSDHFEVTVLWDGREVLKSLVYNAAEAEKILLTQFGLMLRRVIEHADR